MRVRFWGTRGSIATPGPGTNHFGGNTACIQLTTDSGQVLVLDCGTGMRPLGDHLLAERSGAISAAILLTHTHWDHIQGFPFFAPLFIPGNRLRVYGPQGANLSLHDALAGQMEHNYFPVQLDDVAAQIQYRDLEEGTYEIEGLRVRAQKMNHPTATLGYRFESGPRSLCYLTDHEPYFEEIWRDGAAAGQLESIRDAGDRRHAEFMQGAGVVIHEAQYTPEEYTAKRNWGHSTYVYAVRMAAAAGVARLILTHHDPSHDDAFLGRMESSAQELAAELKSPMQVTCAFEGCEVTV
jgi:phosphoribosyl 1,2-cyclic phosphodiesterase